MSRRTRLPLTETPFTRRFDQRVLDYVRLSGKLHLGESRADTAILNKDERIVVALSGGPDSTALLVILSKLPNKLPYSTLSVAHFDHKLRSRDDAAADLAYCESLSKSLGLELAVGKGDVKARVNRTRETVEEAARNLRYRFLGQEAKRRKATTIAVGHTMDDRAETVLLRILRGSGLDGLAAMPPRATWPFGSGPEITRPLLELTRRDTERYCRESGIEPRLDPTNDLPIATRNRIRNELMPVLRSFNPRVEEALARLADAAAGDVSFINEFADAAWRLLSDRDNGAMLLEKKLAKLPSVVVLRIMLRAFREVSVGEAEIDADHLQRLAEAIGKKRARMSLPGGLVATVDSAHLRIERGEPRGITRIKETPLEMPGVTHAVGWTIQAEATSSRARGRKKDEAILDADSIYGTLMVRSRKPGDRLRPLGLGGAKKLQDIFVDAKVPREKRDGVPIIADEGGIVWVAGHCIEERVAVTKATRRVILLKARRIRVDDRGHAS